MPENTAQPETPEVTDSAAQPDEGTESKPETDWVAEARKWEKRAKENSAKLKEYEPKVSEYDRLAEASKTDAERAAEAQKAAEDRASKAMQRVARAEVKAALAGVVADPDSILEDLNLARFMDEDGEINTEAVEALREKFSALGGPRRPKPDQSQASAANGLTKADPASEFAAILQGQMGPR